MKGRRLKKVRGAHLFYRRKKLEISFFQEGTRQNISKFIRKNITHLKDKWMDYGDLLFKPFKPNKAGLFEGSFSCRGRGGGAI